MNNGRCIDKPYHAPMRKRNAEEETNGQGNTIIPTEDNSTKEDIWRDLGVCWEIGWKKKEAGEDSPEGIKAKRLNQNKMNTQTRNYYTSKEGKQGR